MSIEEAIKNLDIMLDSAQRRTRRNIVIPDLIEAIEMAIEALKEKNERKQEWIPCSERLPEEDGRFLVFLPDRNGTFMCADFLGEKWYPDDYECTSNHVIAWMPLPEPYGKEESK